MSSARLLHLLLYPRQKSVGWHVNPRFQTGLTSPKGSKLNWRQQMSIDPHPPTMERTLRQKGAVCFPITNDYCTIRPFAPHEEVDYACGLRSKDRQTMALRDIKTSIFFLGITKLGYPMPIKEAVNRTSPEPNQGKPSLAQFLPSHPSSAGLDYGTLAERFRSIDIYSGLVDGRNYGTYNRLHQQKRRHARHPQGPEERFCIPMTNGMDYGWWLRDKRGLDKTQWYLTCKRFPRIRGEMTKFVDEMAMRNPSFMLF